MSNELNGTSGCATVDLERLVRVLNLGWDAEYMLQLACDYIDAQCDWATFYEYAQREARIDLGDEEFERRAGGDE